MLISCTGTRIQELVTMSRREDAKASGRSAVPTSRISCPDAVAVAVAVAVATSRRVLAADAEYAVRCDAMLYMCLRCAEVELGREG